MRIQIRKNIHQMAALGVVSIWCAIAQIQEISAVTLMTQPGFHQVTVGESLNLSATATGTGLRYQWHKNGVVINGQTTKTLAIPNAKESDSGTYLLKVSDNKGDVKWTDPGIVTVRPKSGGTINICNWNIGPSNRSVPVINPATNLPLTGTGWYAQPYIGLSLDDLRPVGPAVPFYGNELPGFWYKQPNSLRTIGHVAPGQSALVQFRVWESGKGVTFEAALEAQSNFFASNIFSYPTGGAGTPPSIAPAPEGLNEFFYNSGLPALEARIIHPPVSLSVVVGASAALQVEAEGPGLKYQWFKNGEPVTGSDSPALNFSSASLEDQGSYFVEVTDENGKSVASDWVILLVNPASGGTLNICNWNIGPDNRDVPVIHPTTNKPLEGTSWLAQTFVGLTPYDLVPTGPAMYFFGSEFPGHWTKAPTQTRRIDFIPAGGTATIQFRVWQTSQGPDFESAITHGSDFFASNIFEIQLGGAGSPPSFPTDPLGLEEFFFNDGLPIREATIVTSPQSIQVPGGEPLSLYVDAVGKDLSYQWYWNGSAIENSNNPELDFGRAEAADEGTYSVIISDAFGNTAQSSPAVVVVLADSGGTVDICNWNLDQNQRGVPVIHPDGGKPLTGTAWLAQMFSGPDAQNLAPVGPAMPFYGEEFPGFWFKAPNSTRRIPGVTPGAMTTLQFRVWEASRGPEFESALENGSNYFASNIFTIQTGGAGSPPSFPAKLTGLTEFFFNDGLPPDQATLIGQSPSGNVLEGESISLSIEATGPGLKYRWTLNGMPFPLVSGPILNLKKANISNQGTYQVEIVDENGFSVWSKPMVLLVTPMSGGTFNVCNWGLAPDQRAVPVIHPDSQEALTGNDWYAQPFVGSDKFNLIPVGPPVPFYDDNFPGFYLKEPTPTRRAPHIAAGGNATIQVRVWQKGFGFGFEESIARGAHYFASNIFVVATGGAGSPPTLPSNMDGLEEFFHNSGLPPTEATILSQPSHVRTTEGGEFVLQVGADGPGLIYQWFKNGSPIPNSNQPELTFPAARLADQGTYDVLVSDENGIEILSTPAIVVINTTFGGSIDICNWNIGPDQKGIPVVDPTTNMPLAGRDWMAQPYIGTNSYDLQPVGPALPFYTDSLAGFYRKELTSTRIIPFIQPGQPATVQIRVWQTRGGPDFESALAHGVNFFASNIFPVITGGAGSPPAFPAQLDGLTEFYYNSGLPVSEISWPQPAAIEYGVALGDDQLNAQTSAPGQFTYTPAAGTILPAGTHELKAVFSPDSTASEPIEISTTITVLKATPTFKGGPLTKWPAKSPASVFLFARLHFNVPGAFSATLNGGQPVEFGVTQFNAGPNSVVAVFQPTDSSNFNPVTVEFIVEGLKPKEENIKPENTEVTNNEISIELPAIENTFYQIEFSLDLIHWKMVFVSEDDQSADFKAALLDSQDSGFYRIRSFTRTTN